MYFQRSMMFGYVFITICMYCLIVYCHGAKFGEDCTTASDCTGGYQICDGTNKTCRCVDGYIVNTAGNCVGELGRSCTSVIHCADPATICTRGICAYNTATYHVSFGSGSGGTYATKKSLGEQCPNPRTSRVPSTDSCMDRNSKCRYSGTSYSCQCIGGFTIDNGQCVQIPVTFDGDWTYWSGWTRCTVTCGGSSQTRTRSCTIPATQNDDCQCPGVGTEYQNCNTQACPGTITVSRCECQSSLDMKAVIVGVVLRLVILILVLYSGFVTLKLRRSIANNEQLRQAELNTKLQPTYMNDVFQNVTMPDNQVEGTENLAA